MLVILIFCSILLCVSLTFLIKLFVRWDKKFDNVCNKIPGPPAWPLVGNTFQFAVSAEDLLPLFDKWVKEYGHRIIYRIGTYYIVALSNPKDVEKMLTNTNEIVKSIDYEQLIPWLGEGLLVSKGEKWAKRRKLLTPAFHFQILERFMEVFNQQSFKFVNILCRKFQSGVELDVAPLISRLTLDIICETAMGVKIDSQEQDKEADYITAITRLKYLQQYRAFRPWLEPSFIWNTFSYGKEEKSLIKVSHNFTNKVILQRKQEFPHASGENTKDLGSAPADYSTKTRSAFLDLLIKAQHEGHLSSDEDVREETDTFMFEGHDTVAAALGFTLFLIGNHPDVQVKVHHELEQVFGNDSSRPVTMQDLSKLKYLECCIKESLRLCPSVPLIARSLQNDFELDSGVILPRDTLILILPYQLHRNEDVFHDPLSFQPERFLSENSTRSPFAFVPFSAGSRNCIGQKFALFEEKVVLANILRRIRVTSMQTMDQITLLSDLVLHSKDGLRLKYWLKE